MLDGRGIVLGVALAAFAGLAAAAEAPASPPLPPAPPQPLQIARATGPIEVDGDLGDAAWKDAAPVERWFETNPGDNIEPKVRNVARLAYDDKYVYAAFEFDDPDPKKIRAPYADRDNVDSTTDYGGIILDPDNDRKTAILFLANPRGIQYDSLNSDTNGSEDNAPDWFWDSAGKINDHGWTLEIRIPFSSLRYPKADPQTWGVMLYRNWPRDRRYQMFTVRLPRESSCFICNEASLEGLTGLPPGGNWVVAPYGVARQESVPRGDLGSDLVHPAPEYEAGVDAKWTPTALTTVDMTVNPDFSQVESDVAQITANERFALFFPEKRPFFLEGVDLFATPIQAVYTRTITDPNWGARATGRIGKTAYTGLLTEDDGGGLVVIPGPDGSDFGPQDFDSLVAIGRMRHDLGQSFVSGLFTDREVQGGGHNRLIGPDFQWRPTAGDTVTGQILYSDTRTPDLIGDPFAPTEWDGRRMRSHAGDVWYQHTDPHWDAYTEYRDFGDGFRADTGFVPQVGFREGFAEGGYTIRPTKGFLSRERTFLQYDYVEDRDGRLIQNFVSPGVGMDGLVNSFLRFWLVEEHVRAIESVTAGVPDFKLLHRRRFRTSLSCSPWSWLTRIGFDGTYGKDADFVEARPGHGGQVAFNATVRPTDHLALELIADRRWLDVETGTGGDEPRLFTETVQRLKATYTFNRKSFLRLIGQRQSRLQDPALFSTPVEAKFVATNFSALFAYKLNWQSVLFFGYGDDRLWSPVTTDLEPFNQSLFLKVSYAFQL